MEIDNNKKVEQLLQTQLLTQVLKSSLGDSPTFDLVLESLTKAMADKNGGLSLGSIDLKDIGYGGNEKLVQDIKNAASNIKSNNPKVNEIVANISRKFGVDKDLIMAVIKQESSFQPNCVSQAGAMGLMQLMPETASEMGVTNPYDIEQNINGGTKYLRGLLDMYGNSKELALAAYNAGPGTLQNRGVKNKSDIERLPYETRDYVRKVMKYYGK
ncbi:lytic transglycosylase domain-containing protein [Clostridium lundense]|uniref:lytic transglycosylase domain-containing protein n=1 Tax=Clostridium lundense TaxID=319475 RepID=UPI000485F091|nr:lytic transglycosylase domain-containing protein [Clostridium lundense]